MVNRTLALRHRIQSNQVNDFSVRNLSQMAPWWAVLGSFLFSAAVGIFFGYYRARKAENFDPIEALRYE